jgi:RimJ/RimL family protein N-acetyltransferase
LKKEIYRMGRVPAARCNISNRASKATLLKAGFTPCGFRLKGTIKGKNLSS